MHRQLKSGANTCELAQAETGDASPMFRQFSARSMQNGTVLEGLFVNAFVTIY
jgi:hypothetical protein